MKDFFSKQPSQQSSRQYRVADQIKKELAQIIQREVKDPRLGMVTVTEVQVSKDLSYADVYFTNMLDKGDADEQKQQEQILKRATNFLRRRVGQEVKLRIVPQLRFHYDTVQSNANELSALITQAVEQDKARASSSDVESDESEQSES